MIILEEKYKNLFKNSLYMHDDSIVVILMHDKGSEKFPQTIRKSCTPNQYYLVKKLTNGKYEMITRNKYIKTKPDVPVYLRPSPIYQEFEIVGNVYGAFCSFPVINININAYKYYFSNGDVLPLLDHHDSIIFKQKFKKLNIDDIQVLELT